MQYITEVILKVDDNWSLANDINHEEYIKQETQWIS